MVKTSDFESENSGSSPAEAASMVERVTKAIEGVMRTESFDGTDEAQRRLCRQAAITAIEAMREPSDKMIKAGADAQAKHDRRFEGDNAQEIYEAMIDEAQRT